MDSLPAEVVQLVVLECARDQDSALSRLSVVNSFLYMLVHDMFLRLNTPLMKPLWERLVINYCHINWFLKDSAYDHWKINVLSKLQRKVQWSVLKQLHSTSPMEVVVVERSDLDIFAHCGKVMACVASALFLLPNPTRISRMPMGDLNLLCLIISFLGPLRFLMMQMNEVARKSVSHFMTFYRLFPSTLIFMGFFAIIFGILNGEMKTFVEKALCIIYGCLLAGIPLFNRLDDIRSCIPLVALQALWTTLDILLADA